jgi:hypothetical protein
VHGRSGRNVPGATDGLRYQVIQVIKEGIIPGRRGLLLISVPDAGRLHHHDPRR